MPKQKTKKQPTVAKLNLIPPYVKAAKYVSPAIIGTVVGMLLIFGGWLYWWFYNSSEITSLTEDLNVKTAEAEKVLAMQREAQQIRQNISNLLTRLQILDEIKKSGKGWTEPLRQIALWVPDYVRLTATLWVGGSTQASDILLVGYTTSLRRLRDFYSHLNRSSLFAGVSLLGFLWNGSIYSGAGLPPVTPEGLVGAPEITPEPQPTLPSIPGGMPSLGLGGGAGGIDQNQLAQFIDPTAPRNAVYFAIQLKLTKPVQVVPSLLTTTTGTGEGAPSGLGVPPPQVTGPAAPPPEITGPAAPPPSPPPEKKEDEELRGLGKVKGLGPEGE